MLPRLLLLSCLLFSLAVCGCRDTGTVPIAPVARPTEPPTQFPMTITDDLGTEMTFDKAPQRIISLAPSLTELLFALGIGDRIVGVTTYCKYPPEALKIEKVGGYIDSSQERIVSLNPDVIFCTRGTPKTFMDALRKSGLRVFAFDQSSYDQTIQSVLTTGRVCGVLPAAEPIAEKLRQVREEISARTQTLKPEQRPRALLIVSLQPLFVGGPGSFQHDMLTASGAEDCSGLKAAFGALSEEAVIQADPQVLVFTSEDSGVKITAEGQLKKLRASAVWKNVTAVKEGRIVVVNVDHFSIPGPRLALGFRELAHGLHPELFPAK